MDEEQQQALRRVATFAAIGCVIAMVMGIVGPYLFYQLTPATYFYDVHELSIDDSGLQPNQSQKLVNASIVRTVRIPTRGNVFIEVQRINGDNSRTAVSRENYSTYFESGTQSYTLQYPIKNGGRLEPGTYQIFLSLEMNLPYNTNRQLEVRSNRFNLQSKSTVTNATSTVTTTTTPTASA